MATRTDNIETGKHDKLMLAEMETLKIIKNKNRGAEKVQLRSVEKKSFVT